MHRKDDGAGPPREATKEALGVKPGAPMEEESTPGGEVRHPSLKERSVPSAVVQPVELPTDPRLESVQDEVLQEIEDIHLEEISNASSLRRQRINLADVPEEEEVDLSSSSEARDGRAVSVTEGQRPPSSPPPPPDPSHGSRRDEAARLDDQGSQPPVSLHDPRIGTILTGRYRIEKLVGKGGMGRVYLATQFPLNRPVAVKILNPEFQKKDPQFVRRFFLEASTAARLTHPNTITVFDYGESEAGELFIVMEYLKGRPLSKVITNEAPFSAERTVHIGVQICRALREAHQKGIIHRDLKPGNILLLEEGDDADFVKVLDFGLVKVFTPTGQQSTGMGTEPETPGPGLEAQGDLTRAGMFLGSPKYMSPEQIQGSTVDPRTDIYSLGVLMFQMLAGKPPFSGSTSVEVIYKHVNHPVPRIAEVTPGLDVPEELEAAILKCLSKSSDDRFASMADLLTRLKEMRRVFTGVSSTDLGGSIPHDLHHPGSHLSVSESMAPIEISMPGSRRPQTRPGSQSQSGSVKSSPALAKTTMPDVVHSKEAAFVDLADDLTPSSVLRQRSQGKAGGGQGRLTKLAPVFAGGALLLALAVLGYVYTIGTRRVEPPRNDPSAEAQSAEVRVAFASTPEGADVFADGKRLGTTPFVHVFVSPGDAPQRFVFKLKGFVDEPISEKLETASMKIHARMRADSAAREGREAREPREAKKGPAGETEYKENPY